MDAVTVDWNDTQSIAGFVVTCMQADNMAAFYNTRQWRKVSRAVLELDHYECQLCRANGRLSRAKIAHHVNYLKARPDLALCIWITHSDGTRSRNIIAVCEACHEREHNRLATFLAAHTKPSVTVERW